MSLIKCKECGSNVSTKAKACPKCGAVRQKPTSVFTWIVALFFVPIFMMVLFKDASRDTRPSAASTLAAAPASPVVANCDKGAARAVMDTLAARAKVTESGGVMRYEWGPSIDYDSSDRRLRMITLVANADACLFGGAREMRHFLNGRYFGIASPTMGIRLMD